MPWTAEQRREYMREYQRRRNGYYERAAAAAKARKRAEAQLARWAKQREAKAIDWVAVEMARKAQSMARTKAAEVMFGSYKKAKRAGASDALLDAKAMQTAILRHINKGTRK